MAEIDITKECESLLGKCMISMQKLKRRKIQPKLAILQVGEKPADESFIKAQSRVLDRLGCDVIVGKLPENCRVDELTDGLKSVNSAPYIHGIITCRPLEEKEFNQAVFALTEASKDIDGASYVNQGKLMAGAEDGFAPTTAEAIVCLCEKHSEKLEGLKVCIINNSDLIGKPLAVMLSRKMASVSIMHHLSRPEDIKAETLSSDIVVVAAPSENLLTEDMLKPDSMVINAAYIPGGGSACSEAVINAAKYYFSPKSVGKMTCILNSVKLIRVALKN